MANEAVKIYEGPDNAISRTISDAVAVTKGSIMILSNNNTASGSTIAHTGTSFAGIAEADKVASDGSTTLACAMGGVYDLVTVPAPTITVGTAVCISGSNLIRACAAGDLLTGALIGYSEETSTGSDAIRVRLRGI